jgi:hypothetical protein
MCRPFMQKCIKTEVPFLHGGVRRKQEGKPEEIKQVRF